MASVPSSNKHRFGQAAPVFTTTRSRPRFVICSEVTEADCGRRMPYDAEHCGDPTHVRYVATDEELGEALSIRRNQRRRTTLTVNEDYDDADVVPGAPRAITDTFDPQAIWVSRRVQASFCEYHDTTPQEAIANLRLVAAKATANGTHKTNDAGFHTLWWNGFEVVATPDLQAIIRYKTNHYERTPQMVADGIPSRLRGARKKNRLAQEKTVEGQARIAANLAAIDAAGLKEGEQTPAVIDGFARFGVFCRIGDTVGLLHASNLPDGLEQFRAANHLGDTITVTIDKIDRERGRLSLRPAAHRAS